jgi:hypothetical protein
MIFRSANVDASVIWPSVCSYWLAFLRFSFVSFVSFVMNAFAGALVVDAPMEILALLGCRP